MCDAYWISYNKPTFQNTVYIFKKTFVTDSKKIVADVCADSRYQLFINGKFVAEGPSKGNEHVTYYDEVDVSNYLKQGENTIEAKVLFLAEDLFWSAVPRKNRVAFLFSSDVCSTDETWECAEANYKFNKPKYIHPNGPMNEEHIYNDIPMEFEKANKLYKWVHCQTNSWGCLEKYEIKKAIIPLIKAEKSRTFENAVFPHVIKTTNETSFVDFEADEYVTAYPVIEFSGIGDVRIIYAEAYSRMNKDNWPKKNYDRNDKSGDIIGEGDLLHIDTNNAVYSPYWFKTFRYVRVEVQPNSNITIKNAKYKPFRYPLEIENDFECSDSSFNKMWRVGINTLLNCMHETYEDCPYYEQQQYSEDAYLEVLYTMMLSKDYAPIKKCIYDLFLSQTEDGMLLASSPAYNRQQTTGFAIFPIMMIDKYVQYSNDFAFAKEYLSSIDKILSLFERYIDKNGVVGVMPYGYFIDWVKEWNGSFYPHNSEESPICIINCMYSYALQVSEKLCRLCNRNGLADEYKERYLRLNLNIRKFFYDEKRELYRDSFADNFSEHSQIWAVLSGVSENPKKLLNNMDGAYKCSFSYSFFKLRAYEKAGMIYTLKKELSGWQQMLDQNATAFFEHPGEARSDCHGWSSVPIYEFTTKLLGIKKCGDDVVVIKPECEGVTWAKGTLPLKKGNISVSWKIENGKFSINVVSPETILKRIILPSGEEFELYNQDIAL